MHALVTNDDGIQSFFMHRLVEALLAAGFEVTVAAPAFEQSWIGRAITRRRPIHVGEAPDFPHDCVAWMLDGTPSDCVNIALGNLLDRRPDIVVSGINIGFNTMETLILSSGTVAGAIEGMLWGLPAVAFSKCVPGEAFDQVRGDNGRATGKLAGSLSTAAETAAAMTAAIAAEPPPPGCLYNINFPADTRPGLEVEDTVLAKVGIGSLFEPGGDGTFHFRYAASAPPAVAPDSDRACLGRGNISRTLLDFTRLSRKA